ncbi:hypothetical protein O4H52_13690 [Sphingomonadaceae bacterium G21617-S1]|jgi:hypothetical protein|nr:hypothetical protein [Sphingomonadaceae bacterium G21617-S1]
MNDAEHLPLYKIGAVLGRLMNFVGQESRIFWRFLLAILLIAGASLPAASHAKGERFDKECSAVNARLITVAEASLNRKKLEQACVRISGISDGWTLYGSFGDIYRNTDAWEEHRHKRWMAGRIGLRPFPEADDDGDTLPEGGTWSWSRKVPRRVTLIGRLHDCSLDWSRGDPNSDDFEIRMGTGWCHYNSGAVLRPVAIVAESPVKFIRMTGTRARGKYGDVVPLRNDATLTATIMAFLNRLFDAVRRGDRRAVLDLYDYSEIALAPNGIEISEDELAEEADIDPAVSAQHTLKLLFGSPDTPLSRAVRDGAPAVRLFAPRWKTEHEPDAWACWTAARSAEKDWPISSIDAFNVAGRPYACISVVKDSSITGGISVDDTVPYRPWTTVEPTDR